MSGPLATVQAALRSEQLAAPAAIAAAFAATTRAAVGIIAELNHHRIHVMMVFGPVIADEDHQSSPPSSVQLSLNLFRARGHPVAT